jgi:hypothetical protein
MGETASAHAVSQFHAGMSRLAWLFSQHPELKGLQATVDQQGHVDIIVNAGAGVLHDWVHALPEAKRTRGLFSLQSGPAFEELLTADHLTIHVRPKGGQS